MLIQICVGSSCCIKGSYEIVDLFTKEIEEHRLDDSVALAGSFCAGRCNRDGVTVQIDDVIYTGVTKESSKAFFQEHVIDVIQKERG